MKKFFAREFLWLLLTLVLAFPLALVFLWLLGFTTETVDLREQEKDYLVTLYMWGYILSVVGVYLVRLIAAAARALSGN